MIAELMRSMSTPQSMIQSYSILEHWSILVLVHSDLLVHTGFLNQTIPVTQLRYLKWPRSKAQLFPESSTSAWLALLVGAESTPKISFIKCTELASFARVLPLKLV